MKKRSERMQKVYVLSETEEQEECRAMGKVQRHLDRDIEQLEELKAYRESYGSRPKLERQFSSLQWKDYQNFLQRLDQAIAAQTQVVMNGRQNRDAHRRRWMAKRRKAESLERVVERYRNEETTERERNLQKATDDLARNGALFPDPAR